ncbi:tol-pal system protein YbgF [Allochromatium palmeri]|uniref:Cell division coordinator CpoB n=1 Tax=Allochromatium palmeri TaxID=231048 RepID=A0A6N8EFZ5_9GAMM|nr:tol-pal system protein YbgF [Allochromatium palmeri]MTW21467.1 tol-pal system protein YbgF [Allochromatium palmeri]
MPPFVRSLSLPVMLVLGGLIAPSLWAADPEIEGRIGRLERILENQSGSDLLLQMQRLQSEMQELRGMVEQQRFDIERLQRQQRDQFLDLDARLAGTGRSNQPGEGEAAGSTVQPGLVDASGTGLDAPPGATPAETPIAPPVPFSPGSAGIPALPAPETFGASERDLYSQAFEHLKERRYQEAKTAFNDLLRRYPQGEYADNARYWLGETYYVLREYPAALAEYDRLVQLSPASPKVPGALLKIGFIQYEQNAIEPARATLERVIRDYPNSTEARLARDRLERGVRELRP